ncbi:hypothetical protein KY285_014226 [Solanum tuberosum]|nr:hypothetical protein KY285_014226 [Solanum tuberosum]
MASRLFHLVPAISCQQGDWKLNSSIHLNAQIPFAGFPTFTTTSSSIYKWSWYLHWQSRFATTEKSRAKFRKQDTANITACASAKDHKY